MAIPKEHVFTRGDGKIFIQRGVKGGRGQIGEAAHKDELKDAKQALEAK